MGDADCERTGAYGLRMNTPEEILKTAQTIRDAGVLIFERRCWLDETFLSPYDGKMYRSVHGCGSYFRWAHGLPYICPFCAFQFDYSQKFPYTNPNLYPLTLNYTGIAAILTDEETDLRKRSSEGLTVEGELEKSMAL